MGCRKSSSNSYLSFPLFLWRVGPLIYARMLGLVQRRRSVCLRRPLRKENIAIAIASAARERREGSLFMSLLEWEEWRVEEKWRKEAEGEARVLPSRQSFYDIGARKSCKDMREVRSE